MSRGAEAPPEQPLAARTTVLDRELAGTKEPLANSGQYLDGSVASLKVLIFGSRQLTGRKLYCKFYHCFRKHKTSTCRAKKNPFWNEWFPLFHVVGRLEPQIHVEVWGAGIIGNEIKGQFPVNFTSVLDGRDIFIDKHYEIKGCSGEIRVKVINIDRLPKWVNSTAAKAALELIERSDPDGHLAYQIDLMKSKYPHIPYEVITNVCNVHCWSHLKADAALKNMPTGRMLKGGYVDINKIRPRGTLPRVADPGDGCLGVRMLKNEDHDSYMMRLNDAKADELLKMLPEVEREEIVQALKNNNYHICLAADELILRHRGSSLTVGPTAKSSTSTGKGGKAISVSKVESIASEGGFLHVKQDSKRGQKFVVHTSMMQNDAGSRTPGKDIYEKRQKLFQMKLEANKENNED